jgi:hypothetical protein
MRSPRESMAADMAETRSSSTSGGKAEAIIRPSTLTKAEASTSVELVCKSLKRSVICSVLDFAIALHLLSPWLTIAKALKLPSSYELPTESKARRLRRLSAHIPIIAQL